MTDSRQSDTTAAQPPEMTTADWWVLWTHHHEAEFAAADRQEYADAQHHKQRAEVIRRYLKPEEFQHGRE